MRRKISSATDITTVFPVMVTPHKVMQPPIPAPFDGPTLELDVALEWPGGTIGGRHSLAAKVKHRGVAVALFTHDCGVGIPHITLLPLPDPLGPLHIAMSARKVAFAAQLIRAEKRPLAVTASDMSTPMTACAIVPWPTGLNSTNDLASVDLGVTPGDIAWGWAELLATIAAEELLNADPGGSAAANILKEVLKRALPPAVGLVRAATTDDPVHVSWMINYWFFKLELVVERDAEGNYRWENRSEKDAWLPVRREKDPIEYVQVLFDPTAAGRLVGEWLVTRDPKDGEVPL